MRAFLIFFGLLLSAPVFAADERGKWYVGVGGGQMTYRDVCATADMLTPGGTCDDESNGFKVFVGRDFSKWYGLELAVADAGEAKLVAPASSPGTLNINSRLATLWGTLNVPFGDRFALLAKAGLTYFKADYDRTGSYTTLNSGEDGLEPSIGAGFTVNFLNNLALRAEWEKFNDAAGFGNGDIEMLTASLLFRF